VDSTENNDDHVAPIAIADQRYPFFVRAEYACWQIEVLGGYILYDVHDVAASINNRQWVKHRRVFY
jgi:hypothetical protein